MRMRLIPAGSFIMGASPDDNDAYDNEKPQREVTITYPFWMCEFPITQELFKQYMNDHNPSRFDHDTNLPVENVTWHEAAAFANALSVSENLPCAFEEIEEGVFKGIGNGTSDYLACRGYRLPTEAEWEYACRAGTTTPRYGELDDIAWYDGNSGGCTHRVGQKKPNAWGLYDMLGNVWEWVYDEFGGYEGMGTVDPVRTDGGVGRVYRGGSWGSYARDVRSTRRGCFTPTYRFNSLGFRLVIR